MRKRKADKSIQMTSYVKDFISLLDRIKPYKHRYEIFNDWLILASSTLYSTWKKDKSVEDEYVQVAKHYNADELDQLSHLLAITVEALEKKKHDFLGEIFIQGNLSNERNGQFFTPFHISQFMAEVAIGEKNCEKGRVIKISDPCCGSGGLLIAGAIVLEERGINYQKDVIFVGTDIDHRCARMTFIQLSLLAAPALIICGNTLTDEVFWQRETIGYYISGMKNKINLESIIELIKKPEMNIENENE